MSSSSSSTPASSEGSSSSGLLSGSTSSSSVVSGTYGVRLSRRYTDGSTPSAFYRLQVQSHDAAGLPNTIFRYAVVGKNTAGDFLLEFDGVATPLDIEHWPEGPPEPELLQFPSYVRSDKLDLIFPTAEFLSDAWEILIAETTQLIEDIEKLDTLSATATVEVGDADSGDGPSAWWD